MEQILEQGLRDDLGFYKEHLTRTLGELLKSKPEQETVSKCERREFFENVIVDFESAGE